MKERATLVAFFPNRENAKEIPQELRQQGLRKTALIHRTRDSITNYEDVSRGQRIVLGIFTGIFFAGASAAVGRFPFLVSLESKLPVTASLPSLVNATMMSSSNGPLTMLSIWSVPALLSFALPHSLDDYREREVMNLTIGRQ